MCLAMQQNPWGICLLLPFGSQSEGSTDLPIPSAVGVPGKAAVRAGLTVGRAPVEGQLTKPCLRRHIKLLL